MILIPVVFFFFLHPDMIKIMPPVAEINVNTSTVYRGAEIISKWVSVNAASESFF